MLNQVNTTHKIDWRIINWLRGLAAFYVVVNHSRGLLFSDTASYTTNVNAQSNWIIWEWVHVVLMQFTNLGSEFVVFFFLLSGFSIAHSLRNNTDKKGFYFRRLLRLYPTYVLGIVWAIIVYMMIKSFAAQVFYVGVEGHEAMSVVYNKFIEIKAILLNLIYIPTANHLTHQYWSLPHEVIFYLLAPWVIKKYRTVGVIVLSWYIIGWMFSGVSQNEPDTSPILLQFTSDYAIYFFIGILFYQYKDQLISSFRLNKTTTIVCAFVVFLLASMIKGYVFHQIQNKITGLSAVLLAYILLFGSLKHSIRIKPMERIGVYSYTLYVTHIATLFLVKILTLKLGYGYYNIDNMYIWYLGIASSLMIGWLLYYLAELPSTRYIAKMRGRAVFANNKGSVSSIKKKYTSGLIPNNPLAAKLGPFAGDKGNIHQV